MGFRKIDVLPSLAHRSGHIHRIVRAREIDDQVPGLVSGKVPQKLHTIVGDPVVAVSVIGQHRRVGPHGLFDASVLLYVGIGQSTLLQHGQVWATRFAQTAVAAAAIELTLVVDALGEAPGIQISRSVQFPPQILRISESLVQVELSHPRDAVSGISQSLVVRRLIQGIVDIVAQHATPIVAAPGSQAGPRWCTQR